MGLAKLSIWVRDTAHPCLPYQSTSHSFVAVILTCDLQPLTFKAVINGLYPLTDTGKMRGKIHGQPEVPPGCYIVFAFATCKNIFTDMALIQVGCGQEVCVNLISKSLSRCTGEIIWALNIAQYLGPNYSPSSPAGKEIPQKVIKNAKEALEELQRHIPSDPILNAIPISMDELKKMAKKEMDDLNKKAK